MTQKTIKAQKVLFAQNPPKEKLSRYNSLFTHYETLIGFAAAAAVGEKGIPMRKKKSQCLLIYIREREE